MGKRIIHQTAKKHPMDFANFYLIPTTRRVQQIGGALKNTVLSGLKYGTQGPKIAIFILWTLHGKKT
jgi:hypothetical protein